MTSLVAQRSNPSSSDSGPSLAPLARDAVRLFTDRFSKEPRWVVAAPGRVNLIGDHTDYNDGYALPLAIDQYVVIAGAPARGHDVRLRAYSASFRSAVDIPLDRNEFPGTPTWANYLRGVVNAFSEHRPISSSLDIVILSSLPAGGGLSSSAALGVATATLLEVATATRLDPWEKARICQRAEHEYANVPCGLIDQLTSIIGDDSGALLIDCAADVIRRIPFANAGVDVVVVNSNVRHALADGRYAERRQQCADAARFLRVPSLRYATLRMVEKSPRILDPEIRRRARHVVTENSRTVAAAQGLCLGDFQTVGTLMYESHRSLRDDFQVSSNELDLLVDIAAEIGIAGGVVGARMTGGGFGGCIVALVRSERANAVIHSLRREYLARTGLDATGFVSRPSRGAHLMQRLV